MLGGGDDGRGRCGEMLGGGDAGRCWEGSGLTVEKAANAELFLLDMRYHEFSPYLPKKFGSFVARSPFKS